MESTPKHVHALVRLLKSPSDPPSPDGPFKIDIARQVWSDTSFCLANKAEILGEWLIGSLGRDGNRDSESNRQRPIADAKYWSLLQETIVSSSSVSSARPMKVWLLPLLFRINLAGIVTELLMLSHNRSVNNDVCTIYASARAALGILWPLAEKRVGMDALAECFAAVLGSCATWNLHIDYQDDLWWICSTVVNSYSEALADLGNKKKLFTHFLSVHLPLWIRALSHPRSNIPTSLHDALYAAGVDTFFSLDALKQPFDIFLDAFVRACTNHALTILPRLFSERLRAMNRYRTTLFPSVPVSGSSALAIREAVRADAMAAWGSCWKTLSHDTLSAEQGCDQSGERRVEAWSTVVGLLETIEKERLFVPNTILDSATIQNETGTNEAQQTLIDVRQQAIMVIERARLVDHDDTSTDECFSLAVDALDMLVRIDYNLVGGILGQLLPTITRFPPRLSVRTKNAVQSLLSDLLEYHTKTRTLHTYTLALLQSISSPSPPPQLQTTSLHDSVLSAHLSSLSQAFRVALTPNQSTTLGPAVLGELRRTWDIYTTEAGWTKRNSKKRKVTHDGDTPDTKHKEGRCSDESVTRYLSSGSAAIAFTYAARVGGTVLSNLPPHAYTTDSLAVWNDAGNLGWKIVWECLRRVRGDLKEADNIVASAALRFLYDMRARLLRTTSSAVPITLGDSDLLGKDQVYQLLGIVREDGTSRELVLELIRTLFSQVSRTYAHQDGLASTVIQTSVDILAHHFTPTSRWCGSSSTLSREGLGVALLYVFVDRWMDLLDALAPTGVLEHFISLLLSIQLEPLSGATDQFDDQQASHRDITPRDILLNALRSAQFWELHNIRGVFLSLVLNTTGPLSSYGSRLPAAESSPSAKPSVPSDLELDRAGKVYILLMHVPLGYFTRSSRTGFMKRAMGGDFGVCDVLRRIPTERLIGHLTMFRTFLQRMVHSVGPLDHTTSLAYVEHLFDPPPSLSFTSDTLTRVTVDLVLLHLTTLLRTKDSEASASAASMIAILANAKPFSHPSPQESLKHVLAESVVFRLIECLREDFLPSSLSEVVVSSLNNLYQSLLSAHVENVMSDAVYASSRSVNSRSYMLSLAQWLGLDVQTNMTPMGLKLAGALMRSVPGHYLSIKGANTEMCSSVLDLLFQELRCMPAISRTAQLQTIAALYSVHDTRRTLDAQVGTAARGLSLAEFSHLLVVLAEGIEDSGLHVHQSQRLIRLSMVLLHDAPQGTLKVVQNFVTRCLNAFTGKPCLYEGPSEMKIDCLELIMRHCSDRPAALRSVDLGSIWSLLCKILSGSSNHDSVTSSALFHHIVSIASSLVRLRRDLVIHTLPHLASVLHRLVAITRSIRPQLGGKQKKLVSSTFPSWISSTQPLGVAESRALSRLLTTLTIKTVPRTHVHTATASETQKAESLAKPFSKHVGYVLMAYIDALSDPLCSMSPDVRRELQPGLFSLCEMLGEHNRDALVASTLDTGGKAIMKVLWKEYEKQRYVGKG
ncbi:Urb2/Npa2 family-domain-containing protein [Scleroderma citrinum]